MGEVGNTIRLIKVENGEAIIYGGEGVMISPQSTIKLPGKRLYLEMGVTIGYIKEGVIHDVAFLTITPHKVVAHLTEGWEWASP
jgi:hypothetical protein